jgi:hypothetical protein
MRIETNDILKSEEDYRVALKQFIELLDQSDENCDCLVLFDLIRKLQTYEQDNCM